MEKEDKKPDPEKEMTDEELQAWWDGLSDEFKREVWEALLGDLARAGLY